MQHQGLEDIKPLATQGACSLVKQNVLPDPLEQMSDSLEIFGHRHRRHCAVSPLQMG